MNVSEIKKKREEILRERGQFQKLLNELTRTYRENADTLKEAISENDKELYKLQQECPEHVFEGEGNMMGRGICTTCGYNDY